jgi:hypothetical protein
MKAKITLYIYAKIIKANASVQLPIYIRLTVDGERFNSVPRNSLKKRKGRQNFLK